MYKWNTNKIVTLIQIANRYNQQKNVKEKLYFQATTTKLTCKKIVSFHFIQLNTDSSVECCAALTK